MVKPTVTELETFDRRLLLAQLNQRAGLALIGFGVALPVTLMSCNFAISLLGACGLFASGIVAGYQAARIGQVAAGK